MADDEGEVLHVGDLARRPGRKGTYKVTAIHGDEITTYGGTRAHLTTRTFQRSALVKVPAKRAAKDGNDVWRAAVSEVSTNAKQRKKGARR